MGVSKFTAQFRADAVKLMCESNKPLKEIAQSVGVSPKTLREWAKQIDADAGNGAPGVLTSNEKEELAKLRKEIRELRRERDFLKQAAAYFAKVKE